MEAQQSTVRSPKDGNLTGWLLLAFVLAMAAQLLPTALVTIGFAFWAGLLLLGTA
jgi:hypothetical protein